MWQSSVDLEVVDADAEGEGRGVGRTGALVDRWGESVDEFLWSVEKPKSIAEGAIVHDVSGREVLREAMAETHVSQSELSRLSGVRQPSISQFLSGRIEMSDEMLDRLLSCLGYRLEVVRRSVRVELDRSHLRSWSLHRQLATHLDPNALDGWVPTVHRNLERLRSTAQGEPHVSNLDRWERLIEQRDVPGLRLVMTGLDTDSVQMREVSPLGGLMSQEERAKVLQLVGP